MKKYIKNMSYKTLFILNIASWISVAAFSVKLASQVETQGQAALQSVYDIAEKRIIQIEKDLAIEKYKLKQCKLEKIEPHALIIED